MRYLVIICLIHSLVSCNGAATQSNKNIHHSDTIPGSHITGDSLSMTPLQKDSTMPGIDSARLKKSYAVIYAQLISQAGFGNKYVNDTVKVIKVLYNKTPYKFTDTLHVYYYSFAYGLPKQRPCLVYLIPYPLGATELDKNNTWMLLDGTAKTGVVTQ